jgi:hypothetical protein
MTSVSVSGLTSTVSVTTDDNKTVVVPVPVTTVITATTAGPQGAKGDKGEPSDLGSGTDLSITNRTSTTLIVASSTGLDATVPAVSTTLSGLMSADDKLKLDDIDSDIAALAIALS